MKREELESKIIFITTSRYSTFVHRILDEYSNITVNMDGQLYDDKDIPYLKDLCTNKMLGGTLDFLVVKDGKQLFGFHDYAGDMWVDISEIDFVKQLTEEKIIRYRVVSAKPTFCNKILQKLRRLIDFGRTK